MPRSRSTSRTRTSTPRRRSATRKDASSPLAREPSPEPEPPKPPGVLQTLLSLARLKMTVFSAVTYSTAFSLGLQLSDSAENLKSNFPYATFLLGYLFMFLCQLSAHLLGEFYDLPSDSINAKGKGGPFTGGSRVLVDGTRDPKIALWGGWAASMAAGLIFALWIPSTLYPLATLMLLIAHQYSSPPLLLNHCGWGEFTAAIAMNLATPLFAVFLAAPELVDHGLLLGIQTVLQDGTARLLLVPPFFNKIALLLMLNIADRLPDWAAKKRTLAVVLGDGGAIRVHLGLMMLATLSTLWTLDTSFPIVPFPPARAAPLVTTILVLAGLMPGLGISLDLGQLPDPSYHAAKTGWKGEVVRSVKQAPYPVLAVFATVLGLEILADPGVLAAVGLHLRLLPLYVFAYNILSARPPPPRPANEVKWRPPKDPVVIAGAGPAGLAMCLALRQMGFRVRIFEKRTRRELESGADVGLWPASLEVLRALGVQELDTWPVRRVDMVNGDGGLIRKVDMDAVNPPTSGSFALVSRKELISRLLDEVGEENIEFGREVNGFDPARGSGFSVEVIGPRGGAFWVRSTLLVAADGIGSQMRKLLRDGEGRPRYAGEVCHRGVVRVGRSGTVKEVLKTEEGVMKLVYGKGWRGSYGMIGEGVGYWWYKHTLESGAAESLEQVKPDGKGWPAPFGLLLEATDEDSYYVEPVLDRTETWDWGGEEGRVICAGDAAHPVTPNMAQGCSSALIDALLLPLLVRRFLPLLPPALSLLETQYQFHSIRSPHVSAIARASYIQAKIGQWRNPVAVAIREWIMKRIPMENGLKVNREERVGKWVQEWIRYAEEAEKEGWIEADD